MALVNAYDGHLSKLARPDEILKQIKKAIHVQSPYEEVKGFPMVVDGMDVNPFTHPLYDPEKDVVYYDGRSYLKEDRGGKYNIKSQTDYTICSLMAYLEKAWVNDKSKDNMWSAFAISNKLFITWLTDHIVNITGLEQNYYLRLKALICLYSIGLFYNGLSGRELERFAVLVCRNNAIDYNQALSTLSILDGTYPRDIAELVDAIKALDFGPRANNLFVSQLYGNLNRSWNGTPGAGEVMALAMEYPPAWAGLVYMSFRDTQFKRTSVGTLVQKRPKDADSFFRAIDHVVGGVADIDFKK